jgi:hypothetical protein
VLPEANAAIARVGAFVDRMLAKGKAD